MLQVLLYIKHGSNTVAGPHRQNELSKGLTEVTIKKVLPFNENVIFLLGFYKDLCLTQFSIFNYYLHPVTGVRSQWDAKKIP